MKFLLSVIALCLVMITAKLYIPEAQADVAGMDEYDLMSDYAFNDAVTTIVKTECVVNSQDVKNVMSGSYKLTYQINIDC